MHLYDLSTIYNVYDTKTNIQNIQMPCNSELDLYFDLSPAFSLNSLQISWLYLSSLAKDGDGILPALQLGVWTFCKWISFKSLELIECEPSTCRWPPPKALPSSLNVFLGQAFVFGSNSKYIIGLLLPGFKVFVPH